jgi:hypothetical protein
LRYPFGYRKNYNTLIFNIIKINLKKRGEVRKDILKLTKINIPVANEHPFLPADGNTDLSNAVKPKIKAPLPRENRPRNHAYGSTSKGGNGQRKRENSF